MKLRGGRPISSLLRWAVALHHGLTVPIVVTRYNIQTLSLAAALAFLACSSAPALAANVSVAVVDSAGRPLPDAVITLEAPGRAHPAPKPAQGVEISQRNRHFEPSVTVIPVGTSVTFPNRDTVRHHVYSFSPTKTFEIKLYAGVPSSPIVFDKTGLAVLGCNIHDSMIAWVMVVDSPWYGKTGADGHLAIADVPPGSYRLHAWHPLLPDGAAGPDLALTVADAGTQTRVQIAVSLN